LVVRDCPADHERRGSFLVDSSYGWRRP
jgi:hypothetical protein